MTGINRFDYAVWIASAVLLVAIVGVYIAGDRVGVVVSETYPPNNQPASALTRIGVTFGESMVAETVESRLTISPPVVGDFVWSNSQQVWFVPQQALDQSVTYSVQFEAGAQSQQGGEVLEDFNWQFDVREPTLVYMSPAVGPRELWRLDPDGTQTRLTDSEGAIYDFDTAPDGLLVAYGQFNEQNGIDIWVVDSTGSNRRILVNCGADRCYDFAWSPDAKRMAYSRERAQPQGPHGPPRIWTVDTITGETAQLYQDSNVLGFSASWSPDGTRLALFDGGEGAIRVVDLETGIESVLDSWLGMMGSWSPDGRQMMFNDLDRDAVDLPSVVVYLMDFDADGIRPAFAPNPDIVSYSVPVWSPDGEWVVVAVTPSVGGPGAQLWLMRPDGSDPRPVAQDPAFTYGSYRWDPWGQQVVYQRFMLGTPNITPQVMLWSLATGETRLLVENASTPKWLP